MLRKARLNDREQLYDFDLVAFMKKAYDLTYQQAS